MIYILIWKHYHIILFPWELQTYVSGDHCKISRLDSFILWDDVNNFGRAMYLTQSLFPHGKLSRAISLDSHYILIFWKHRQDKCFPNTAITFWSRITMLQANLMGIWWSIVISWYRKTCVLGPILYRGKGKLSTWNVLKPCISFTCVICNAESHERKSTLS